MITSFLNFATNTTGHTGSKNTRITVAKKIRNQEEVVLKRFQSNPKRKQENT